MSLDLPRDALVVLIGAAASGKTTFAKERFASTEVVSSDFFRGLVADDEADQSASEDAFELVEHTVAKRLARGRLTVVDATNLESWVRYRWIDLAARHGRPVVAVVIDVPLQTLLERAAARSDRRVAPSVIRDQERQLRATLRAIDHEGFGRVFVIDTGSPDAVPAER